MHLYEYLSSTLKASIETQVQTRPFQPFSFLQLFPAFSVLGYPGPAFSRVAPLALDLNPSRSLHCSQDLAFYNRSAYNGSGNLWSVTLISYSRFAPPRWCGHKFLTHALSSSALASVLAWCSLGCQATKTLPPSKGSPSERCISKRKSGTCPWEVFACA